MIKPKEKKVLSWDDIQLDAKIKEQISKAGFDKPTEVQAESIPAVLKDIDLMVSAQTGTGKTAAFGLPMIQRIMGRSGTFGLVLAPSREIALQTQAFFEQFGKPLGVNSVALIGGVDLKIDEAALRNYPQIIVATPGRLCDHLERGNLWLDYLEVIVLDEADRMLDMGFSSQLDRIFASVPNTQTLLFSATFPEKVVKLAQKILYQPERIAIGRPVAAATTVEQHFVYVEERNKVSVLHHILYDEPGTVFVFCRSKDGAARLWRALRVRGFHEATQIHSNLEQNVREQALQDFKSGKYRVLIATDVVGRGIHVDGVAHVVNYDIPREPSDYVHRIGRTGRADAVGRATTFVGKEDMRQLRDLEKLLGKKINVER